MLWPAAQKTVTRLPWIPTTTGARIFTAYSILWKQTIYKKFTLTILAAKTPPTGWAIVMLKCAAEIQTGNKHARGQNKKKAGLLFRQTNSWEALPHLSRDLTSPPATTPGFWILNPPASAPPFLFTISNS